MGEEYLYIEQNIVSDEAGLTEVVSSLYDTDYDNKRSGYAFAIGEDDEQTEPSLVEDLAKAFCEDGTWLERQGVYTLTLAEAKQRAVDLIESVASRHEGKVDSMKKEKFSLLEVCDPKFKYGDIAIDSIKHEEICGKTPEILSVDDNGEISYKRKL